MRNAPRWSKPCWGIIDLLHQRVHAFEETVQQLRDEIAVLKGQSPRPKIAPVNPG